MEKSISRLTPGRSQLAGKTGSPCPSGLHKHVKGTEQNPPSAEATRDLSELVPSQCQLLLCLVKIRKELTG